MSHRLPRVIGVFVVTFSWLFVSSSLALECATGIGGSTTQEIPDEWINDGYCDCPVDGVDEPGTNACSGSSNWPGVKKASSTPIRYVFLLVCVCGCVILRLSS